MGRRKGSILGKLSRGLFKAARILNTVRVLRAGSPKRIAKHVIRKEAAKLSGKVVNKIVGS